MPTETADRAAFAPETEAESEALAAYTAVAAEARRVYHALVQQAHATFSACAAPAYSTEWMAAHAQLRRDLDSAACAHETIESPAFAALCSAFGYE